jgi:mono/diheme cytochrome c family protein
MRTASLGAAFVLALGLVVNAALADDQKPADDAKHGKTLFAEHCASCHGAKAEGGLGPSLQGEVKRKPAERIRAQIMNPEPPMAKLFPSVLSQKDVDDVVSYVVTL